MNNLPSVKEMEFVIENLCTWKTPDLNALLGKSVKYLRTRYVILILKRYNSLVAQIVKNLPTMWETRVQSLGWEDPLEKDMATHSSILAQTHVHQVSDAIQPSHPLLSPSPPAFNLSQYQGLFQ